MVKLLNCCGKADHLLFLNHPPALLTYSNTQFTILKTQFQDPIINIQFLLNPNSSGSVLIRKIFIVCKVIAHFEEESDLGLVKRSLIN